MKYIEIFDNDGVLVGVFEPTVGCIPADESNADYQRYLEWLETNG